MIFIHLGFISFDKEKIPFILVGYKINIFSDNENIISEFCKKYNSVNDYFLEGDIFSGGVNTNKIYLLVERSMGTTCYIKGYFITMTSMKEEFNQIGFQSLFLDDILRYKYVFLDEVRNGTNLSLRPNEIYNFLFTMNNKNYEFKYFIGHNSSQGLFENFDKKGEIIIELKNKNDIWECLYLTTILHRLSMFMTFDPIVPFKMITLYNDKQIAGWFYAPSILGNDVPLLDFHYHDLDVNKFIPRILNNIALDSGNIIKNSVPLSHLKTFKDRYSPNHFIEQVTAFEYLFYKLEPSKAQNDTFYLRDELEYCFNMFPEILDGTRFTPKEISRKIKKVRVDITHGYASYYNFKGTDNEYLIMILDKLIRKMSFKLIGFTKDEIKELNFLH